MHLIMAEDDPELAAHLRSVLGSAGHTFDTVSNGPSCRTALQRETYDAGLIDWNMPGATGLEIIEWAVRELPDPPALILITSRAEAGDIVRGLEAGASDYIVKPESDAVILARIEAAVRRKGIAPPPQEVEEYDRYIFDNNLERMTMDGERVSLTSKEFLLARLLFRNVDRPLSRSYIFASIWGGAPNVETRTLDMHISRVRSKLCLRQENGYAIQTVFGFGYRMTANQPQVQES